jgi:hypothetical protein
MRIMASLCASALLAGVAEGRPVTFPGGRMSMTEISGDTISTQIDATLDRRVAVGAFVRSEDGGDRRYAGVLGNFLLMRRNTETSQANAYLMAGVGPARRRGRSDTTAGWAAFEADWETRRWFLGGSTTLSATGRDVETGFRTRVGVAPYVAEAGALHSWLFLQAGRMPEPGADVEVGPVLRLFKGDVLVEGGVTTNGRGFATLWFYF